MKFKIKKEEIEEVIDYSKLPTPVIFGMVREMEAKYGKELKLNKDENLSDSLALNEYYCLKRELDRRTKKGIVKLELDERIARIFTPKRIELLNELSIDSSTIEKLAKKLKRNPKGVSRDLGILEKFGVIGRRKVGRETEVYLIGREFEIVAQRKAEMEG
ncbi:MAG: hypothetical protein ACE5NL_01315 [Candidatus Hydrothermarchaeaceae archaeon]